jgi:hypothetical protein
MLVPEPNVKDVASGFKKTKANNNPNGKLPLSVFSITPKPAPKIVGILFEIGDPAEGAEDVNIPKAKAGMPSSNPPTAGFSESGNFHPSKNMRWMRLINSIKPIAPNPVPTPTNMAVPI